MSRKEFYRYRPFLCGLRAELMLNVRIKRNRMSQRKTISWWAQLDLSRLFAHVRVCIRANVRACVHMYIDEDTYRDGICRQPRCTFAVRGRDHPGRFSAPYWTCTAAFSDRPRPPSATVSANTSFRRSAHIEMVAKEKTCQLSRSTAKSESYPREISILISGKNVLFFSTVRKRQEMIK